MKNENTVQASNQYLDDKTRKLLSDRDPVYLKSLFLEVNPFLVKICSANGIVNEAVGEVVHDTWEKFFSNLDKFEGRSQVRTFICGILFNKIREYRRAQGKIVYEDDSQRVMGNSFTPEGWWKVPPHDPQKLMEFQEASKFIQECLEGLSEHQKSAFLMIEVEGDNFEDICNILDVNVSHLRVLLFRAKDKLRKCLEGRVSVEFSRK